MYGIKKMLCEVRSFFINGRTTPINCSGKSDVAQSHVQLTSAAHTNLSTHLEISQVMGAFPLIVSTVKLDNTNYLIRK